MVAPVLGETKPVQGHTAYLVAKPGTESGQCVHTRCGLPSPRHRPGCGMHGPGPRAGGSGCRAGAGLRVLVRLEVECSSLNALPVGPSSASTKQNVGRRNPRKTYVAWVCSSFRQRVKCPSSWLGALLQHCPQWPRKAFPAFHATLSTVQKI